MRVTGMRVHGDVRPFVGGDVVFFEFRQNPLLERDLCKRLALANAFGRKRESLADDSID